MTREKTLNITIDNKNVKAQQSQTILQAARQNGFFIPSLCALEHLPSYGACRLCIVEVDGIRGYPTACTTPVEEGMVIRTDTAELRTLRQEVLKLMLSEHPASCLFCDEQKSCKQYMGTIRKVGYTTGCRYCPNDTRCELQTIVEKVGLTETSYPVYYRGFEVEKSDPFYDRDYNLCILCGRCVRICNDVRLSGTLSFKQRGKQTTIGPAFERSHLEAGCEFCGACVSVCPTGALSVKTGKWYGMPEGVVGTTCVYCPVGCRLLLQVRSGQVIDVLPDYESEVDRGLICVKGRFAVPEYVHSADRLTTPRKLTPIGYQDIGWDEAIGIAVDKLTGLKPEDFLMIVSPQLNNEDLYAAQEFARKVIGSDNVASSVMASLGADLIPFVNLALGSAPIEGLKNAGAILAVGVDTTYGFSPVGVTVKQAVQGGASLCTIGGGSNLDAFADMALEAAEAKWGRMLQEVFDGVNPAKGKGKAAKGKLRDRDEPNRFMSAAKGDGGKVLILGPEVLAAKPRPDILALAQQFRDALGWSVIVLHPFTNLAGLVAMGAMPGISPGQLVKAETNGKPVVLKAGSLEGYFKAGRKVVYLVGEGVGADLPACDYLIYQNSLPGQFSREPDLIFPASLFVETAGTVISMEGKVLELKSAVASPGNAKPDWWIFSAMAQKMVKGAMKYGSVAAIQKEIRVHLKGFPALKKGLQFVKLFTRTDAKGRAGKGTVPAGVAKSLYRGVPLSSAVSGMKAIEGEGRPQPSADKE